MTSLHDMVSLAERTVSSPHGEFQVAIESIAIHRCGTEIEIKWSVLHLEQQVKQIIILQFCDPLLERCGYKLDSESDKKSVAKELDQELVAKEFMRLLDIEHDKVLHSVTFSFTENGFDIGNPITWDNDVGLIAHCE